jgi:hypothetical protein
LVLRHRGHAVRKLQAQHSDHCREDEKSLAHNYILTLGALDS